MCEQNKLNVFEISRMAMHNGPGIRTMVHFKGCNLNCSWCSTPESRAFERQLSYESKNCICCGRCEKVCPTGAVSLRIEGGVVIDREKCVECFKCTEECCTASLSVIGEFYTADEIYKVIEKDKCFYARSGGGVTFSGGEILLHISDEMIKLLEKLKEGKISVGFDTAGYVSKKNIDKVIPYADYFLWDVKLTDSKLHRKYTGADNAIIIDNLHYVDQHDIDIYLRCPIIPGVNNNDMFFEDLSKLAATLKNLKEINLLPFHQLGASRYTKIGEKDPYAGMGDVSEVYLEKMQQLLIDKGYHTKIIG